MFLVILHISKKNDRYFGYIFFLENQFYFLESLKYEIILNNQIDK